MKHIPNHRLSAKERYDEKHPTYFGANLTDAQYRIAQRVTQGSEKFYIWNAGRQVGKSYTATQILLWFTLNKPNTTSMYVSMTYPQTTKLFKELNRGVKDARIVESCNKNEMEMTFKNGSTILFKSYQNVDSSRGYHISGILIVDEASWMADGDFDQVYLPMLQNHREAKALIISSPKGTNWFYQYYMRGERGSRITNKNYISFKTTYLDNPFCNKEEIEEYRTTMPELIFRQEILAEFISGAGSVFGDRYKKCICDNISKVRRNDEYYVMGIDVGRQNDYSVATIISTISGEVVEILRMRQVSFEMIADSIVAMALRWRPMHILQECNGIGDPFFELLGKKFSAKYINGLEAWTTTNQSKNNIIEALNMSFDECSLKIPNNEDLISELDCFEVNYSLKSRAITYSAREGCHDDMVMSLAIANWSKRTHAGTGSYAFC